MKSKVILIIFIIFLAAYHAIGQGTYDFERRLYNSYVNGKITEWKYVILDMTAKYKQEKETELLYSLCFAQYGYIGYCISNGLKKEAEEFLKDVVKNTKELDDLYDGRHDVLALQGAILGYRMVLSKFRAIYLGPKASKLIITASESSNTYFNCSLEMGNMLFYTPKILGGSKKEAIRYYQKAVEIIEQSTQKEDRNWIYINTVLFLANAYYETGSRDLACDLYAGLLDYEPRATWIRDDLYMRCR